MVLRVMHWSGGGGKQEDAIVADSIDAFMAEHPGTRVIRINPGDPGQFYTKLQTMMAAGDPPDLFYMNFERLPVFVDADQLMELDPLIRDDSGFGLDDFFPSTVEAFHGAVFSSRSSISIRSGNLCAWRAAVIPA